MKNKKVQISIAYVYHAIFIPLGFLLMRHYSDIFLTVCAVADILYLIYWIVLNRKGYMPWIVYLHFVIGTVIEIFFYASGIIPSTEGFISGIGSSFYILLLLFHAIAMGAANLILCSIDERRHNNGQ